MEILKTKLMEAIIQNTMRDCLIGNNKNPIESQYQSDWGVALFAEQLLLNLERHDMYEIQHSAEKQNEEEEKE